MALTLVTTAAPVEIVTLTLRLAPAAAVDATLTKLDGIFRRYVDWEDPLSKALHDWCGRIARLDREQLADKTRCRQLLSPFLDELFSRILKDPTSGKPYQDPVAWDDILWERSFLERFRKDHSNQLTCPDEPASHTYGREVRECAEDLQRQIELKRNDAVAEVEAENKMLAVPISAKLALVAHGRTPEDAAEIAYAHQARKAQVLLKCKIALNYADKFDQIARRHVEATGQLKRDRDAGLALLKQKLEEARNENQATLKELKDKQAQVNASKDATADAQKQQIGILTEKSAKQQATMASYEAQIRQLNAENNNLNGRLSHQENKRQPSFRVFGVDLF